MKINDVVAESQRRALEQGAEFGAYYYEQLAQQVFDQYPNLNNEDNILNFGYAMAKEQLGKRADGIFRDEDFPGDFVSAYFWLKKQKPGVAEGLTDTQKKIEDTILKLEQRLKFAKTPEQWDNIKDRIERLQAGLNRSKQGVAEDTINESPAVDLIRSLISEFNKQMSGSPYYPMDYKNPGMRMWTRGDGSKYKDPGYIFIDRDLKPEDQPKWHKARAVEKFWKFLESKGARKIGDVSGEFGSDPHSPAVVLNKLIFVFNGRSIAWGSTSRLKNSSVWRQKQPGVAEMDSQGYTGTRDPVSKSTYGSRDKGLSSRGPEKTGKALTAKQAMDKAHKAMMKSMSNDEKVDKGWRNPNVDEGVESWSSNPSDRRHPGHESYMTPEYMLAHYKKRLAQIAAGKHKYPKEVAQLQAKIAKLEKPGMSESTGNK